MVQNLLIDTGKMSQDKLLSYMQTEAHRIDPRPDRKPRGRGAPWGGDSQLLWLTAKPARGRERLSRTRPCHCHAPGNTAARQIQPRAGRDVDRWYWCLALIQEYVQSDVNGSLSTPIPVIGFTSPHFGVLGLAWME